MRNAAIKPMMESFVLTNVIPELSSPNGWMRAVVRPSLLSNGVY